MTNPTVRKLMAAKVVVELNDPEPFDATAQQRHGFSA